MKEKKLIHLGRCTKVHGIKGAFIFNLFNEESSVLEEGLRIYLDKDGVLSRSIEKINFSNKVLCSLEGVDDRNKAESLVPFDIYVDRNDFPKESEGEIYLSDLIGFKVINESGKTVGVVNSFYNHGASEVIVIKLKNDDELELPFVESFFPEVNLDKNQVVMVNPEMM